MSEHEPDPDRDAARGRAHPTARFAAPRHEIDLRAIAGELAQTPARRGQRQRALYHHGRLTVALFTFEPGAGLPDHVAAGVVTINVLDGRLRVTAGGVEHDMAAGKLLVLAPGVRHDVLASEPSTMLLQVYLDDPAASAPNP
ncbi:MAG: cupin domain-containing protein [Phycisphaerae bacterium]|nr:cupin domain-containing protein [Tepidisphaeraceae bacterium]